MWLYLLIIAFIVIWFCVYFRTARGEEEPEGYEWMESYRNHAGLKKIKKKKK